MFVFQLQLLLFTGSANNKYKNRNSSSGEWSVSATNQGALGAVVICLIVMKKCVLPKD